MVDIGTGYFMEKVISISLTSVRGSGLIFASLLQGATEAGEFYRARSNELAKTLQDLETILHRKTANVQSIEEGRLAPYFPFHRQSFTCSVVIRNKILDSSQ